MTEPLVDLFDVKKRLNIDPGDATDDAELTLYLASASLVLAELYGDVLPRTYTEIIYPHGDGSRLLLGRSPVLSVTSVKIGWFGTAIPLITLDPSRYRLDKGAGVIQAIGYGPYSSFANIVAPFGGTGSNPEVEVVYVAGRDTISESVQDAVLEILRINWQPQRTGSVMNPDAASDPDAGFTAMGYFIPNGAHERLAGGKRPRQVG